MDISFFRDTPIDQEPRRLPAEVYNLSRLLLARAPQPWVFVPIRPMQYLAVIDAEEIFFTHREAAGEVDIAWTGFRPGLRASLLESVGFTALYYQPEAHVIMKRLPGEFLLALKAVAQRRLRGGTGRVLAFPRAKG